MHNAITNAPMSNDAYAGFLRLLLTPSSKAVSMTQDVRAYLSYVEQCEPLSDIARIAMGQMTVQAA